MRWIGLAVALASCGFRPRASADGGELVVTDTLHDTSGDRDGDGVTDDVDNCPDVANPGQANEDHDDRGDACDLCPHLEGTVPGTDDDDDDDGIGNQCDPRNGKDRLVVFLPFNDPSELDHFEIRGTSISKASWTITNGQLHSTDPSLATPQQLVWTGESIDGPVWVEGFAHVDALAAGGPGTRLAAVTGAYDDSGDVDMYACGLRALDTGNDTLAAAWHFVTPPFVGAVATSIDPVATMANGLAGHESLKITEPTVNNSQQDCVAATRIAGQLVGGYQPAGYPGVRVLGMTASFDYLFVVAIGTP